MELFERVAARERVDAPRFGPSDNRVRSLAGAEGAAHRCGRGLATGPAGADAGADARVAGSPGLPSEAPAPAEQPAAWLSALAAPRPLAGVVLPCGEPPTTPKRLARDRDRLGVYRTAAELAGVPALDARAAFGADPLGDGRLVNGFPDAVPGRGRLNAPGHARLAAVPAGGVPVAFPTLWPVRRAREASSGSRRFFDAGAPGGGGENWRPFALAAAAATRLVRAQTVPAGFVQLRP